MFLVSSCCLEPPAPCRMGLRPAAGGTEHQARLAVHQLASRRPVSRTARWQERPWPSRWRSLGSRMNLLAVDDWAGEPDSTEKHFSKKIDPSLRSRLNPQGRKQKDPKRPRLLQQKFQISLISLLGTFTIVPVQMRPLSL